MTRPILRWHGGKFRLAPWILRFLPPHRRYVEPYAGAASVLLLKDRAPEECLNDVDGAIVNVLRVLRDPDRAAELRRRLALTAFARAELEWSYGEPADELDAAHRTLVRGFLGHGSDAATRACRAGFRGRFSGNGAQDWAEYPDQVPAFVERLRGVMIEHDQALDVISRHDGPGTLFYVDPPALEPADSRGHAVRYGMTAADHRRLAEQLAGVRGMVALSGELGQREGAGHLLDWDCMVLSRHLEGGDRRIEALWLNPAAAQAIIGPRPGRPLFTEAA
ncbi:MAG TPA: DNA adenine methylase [Nevskia sp.]|nr:DNA adenine methylase [Nevskia sp.]